MEKTEIFIDETAGDPTIEESYEALKAEGILSDNTDGASLETPDPDAQGGADQDEGVTDNRPDWLPERFENVDEMLAELDRLENGGEAPEETPAETEAIPAEEITQVTNIVEKAGLNLEALSEKWASDRALPDDAYAALAAQGITRDMVDGYCEGVEVRKSSFIDAVYSTAGGEAEYGDMLIWASENYTEAEIAAYDEAVNSKDKVKARQVVKALRADYDKAQAEFLSDEPTEIVTSGAPPRVDSYETFDDYMADLNDPLYDKSESFRNKVARKLSRSNL